MSAVLQVPELSTNRCHHVRSKRKSRELTANPRMPIRVQGDGVQPLGPQVRGACVFLQFPLKWTILGTQEWLGAVRCIGQSLLACESGFSRETDHGLWIETQKGLMRGTGSSGCGGWEVPPSAVCRLDTQESWWRD